MPSELQRVAADLLACLDQIPRMTEYLHRVAQTCRQQAGDLTALGSTNPGARTAALQLDSAARACDEAAEHAARVPPRANAWVEQMVSGHRPASGDDTPRGRSATIMRRLPKRDPGNSDPTTGIFVAPDGQEQGFVSGRGDALEKSALDLCKDKNWPPYDRTSHTEIKVATHMRLNNLKHGILYLNNEPCDLPGTNCRKLLPRFLPPGAQLVIFGPNGYEEIFKGKSEGQ
ncbi:SCP1.201-like deaminase [Kribbella hippodromi]|uniref:SCP1.201-like deaminase n=1 Tax=Kribbella hippodromi TaxID=434347 RepID=A0ABN2EBE3_9ACTN